MLDPVGYLQLLQTPESLNPFNFAVRRCDWAILPGFEYKIRLTSAICVSFCPIFAAHWPRSSIE
jgi:hypothetical protein